VTAYRTVTTPDPERTASSLESARALDLEAALERGICDPGAFLPRRMSGRKGDREFEPLSQWAARACALIVLDRKVAS
jgi:hypothetical protein